MKRVIAITMIALQTLGLSAAINFGSRESAIETTGGTVALGSSKTLSRGTLRDRSGSAAITGTTLTCDEMTIETRDGSSTQSLKADGTVTLAGDVVLGNSDVLNANGGSVPGTVTADGADATPSIIRGTGTFANDIEVNNDNTAGSDKELQIEWDGELNVNVQLNGTDSNMAKLTLGSDLVFAPGKGITCSVDDKIDENVVVCNGHALVFNGDTELSANDQISLDTPIIVNNGLLTISDTAKIITGAMKFAGGRVAGAAGFNGNSLGGTFNNVHFTNFTENTLGSSSCTWTFNNCILGEANNVEALTVKQGGLTGGKTDIFDGDSTWADYSIVKVNSDIALAGDLTAGADMIIDGQGHTIDLGFSSTINDGDNDISILNATIDQFGNTGLVTTDTGTQTWTMRNVVLNDKTNKVTLSIDGQWYAPSGTNVNPTAASVYWTDLRNNISLLSDLTLPADWVVLGGRILKVDGHSNKLNVSSGGLLLAGGTGEVLLSNIHFTNLQTGTFQNQSAVSVSDQGFYTLRNVVLSGSNGSQTNEIRVTGKLKQDNDNDVGSTIYYADVFNEAEGAVANLKVSWSDSPRIKLERDLHLTNNWKFATDTLIEGAGYTLDMSSSKALLDIDGTFSLTNITLKDVAAANIDTQGAQTLTLRDVKWYDSASGAVHIHGSQGPSTGPASMTLTAADDAGDIFGSSGGNVATVFGTDGVKIDLLADCTLAYEWEFDGASSLNGNGYTFAFLDTNGTFDIDAHVHLSDISLANVTADSFDADGSAELRLNEVSWFDGTNGNAVKISGRRAADAISYATVLLPTGAAKGDLFDTTQTTQFSNAHIELLTNISSPNNAPTWDLQAACEIVGNGHVWNTTNFIFDLNNDLTLSDIILTEVADGTFANAGGSSLFLSNVTIADAADNGLVRITASTVDASSAQDRAEVILASSDTDTNFFDTAVNFSNGANIHLEKDLTLGAGATWTFGQDSMINGHGNKFNLQNGALNIGTNSLHLKNMIIDGMTATAIADTAGTVTMSDVTIVLSESLSLTSKNYDIDITGPVTFVTGTKTFAAPTGSTITGVTVWYDTLGNTVASDRVTGFTLQSDGRVAVVGASSAGVSLTFSDGGTEEITTSYDLSPDGNSGTGTQVTFNGGTDFTFDGNGNTFYIADVTDASTKPVLTVSGTTVIDMVNVTLDGFQEDALSLSTVDDDQMIFNVGSVLRLQSDQDLTQTLTFAKGSGITTSQTYSSVIDLNGHEFDLADASAELKLQDEANLNLLIKNGRLTNVSGGKIGVLSASAGSNPTNTGTVTFEDVELVLADDTTLSWSNLMFKGNCRIVGETDKTLNLWHTAATIDAGSTLYVGDGMTLAFKGNNAAAVSTDASLAFSSVNSTLFLDNATISLTTGDESDTLTFHTGTIKVDGIATFDIDPGSQTNYLNLGSVESGNNKSVELDLQPGASIVVSSGTLTYADDENAGNDD